jgi:hypothetical protein
MCIMEANQRVSFSVGTDGGVRVISLQNRSTPGVRQKYILEDNCSYRIVLTGIKNQKRGKVQLWIGDQKRETLYLSKDSLDYERISTLDIVFNNHTKIKVHIGALFGDDGTLQIGDSFTIYRLSIKKIERAVSATQVEDFKTEHNEKAQEIIKKLYDNSWKTMTTFIEKHLRPDIYPTLESLWYRIVEYEYKDTVRDFIHYPSETVPYQNNEQFVKAIQFSRQPILDKVREEQFDAVMEFGAGWGKNIFYCLSQIELQTDWYCLEPCRSGLKLFENLRDRFSLSKNRLNAGFFDFNDPQMPKNRTYRSVFIFTMWSIKEITYLNKMFFYKLLETYENIEAIHIEPVGWQISSEHQVAPKDFYNRNLCELLFDLESEGRIEITDIQERFIGFFSVANTASLISWRKTR